MAAVYTYLKLFADYNIFLLKALHANKSRGVGLFFI